MGHSSCAGSSCAGSSCLAGGTPEVGGRCLIKAGAHIIWSDALNTELLDENHLALREDQTSSAYLKNGFSYLSPQCSKVPLCK